MFNDTTIYELFYLAVSDNIRYCLTTSYNNIIRIHQIMENTIGKYLMSQSDKVTAVLPKSLKAKLKEYAIAKRWTMSKAIEYLVEKGISEETNQNEPQELKLDESTNI